MEIHYEPHPVTPERKAELRAQGYKIIDARFAPAGWAPAGAGIPQTPGDIDAMRKGELRELLEAHGVEGMMPVAEMRGLLKQIMFMEA